MLLWAALPPVLRDRTFPAVAADYWQRNAVRRYFAGQVFKAVFVERNHVDRAHNPLVPMLRALDEGNSLIVFPEGTRGNGERLQPFKCGLYHLAHARPEVELIPVWIDYLSRVLPKGAMVPAPMLCSVNFGAPAHLRPDENKHDFLGRLAAMVTALGESCKTNRF